MLERHGQQERDFVTSQRLNLSRRFAALPEVLPHPQHRVCIDEFILNRLAEHRAQRTQNALHRRNAQDLWRDRRR